MKLPIRKIANTIAFATLGMLGMTSCNKLANYLQYDLAMQTATVNFTIPPCPNTNIAVAGSQTVYYNIDSFIKANTMNTMGIANITSAKVASCQITLLDPTTANNFANFKSCTSSFYSDADATPYQMNISDNPDVYATSLTLPVDTSSELKGYLTNGRQFTYSLSGNLRRPTKDSIHCTATISFKVHVQGI